MPADSIASRSLFFAAGVTTAAAMSAAGIGGLWTVPVAIGSLFVFGELYLSLSGSGDRQTGDGPSKR